MKGGNGWDKVAIFCARSVLPMVGFGNMIMGSYKSYMKWPSAFELSQHIVYLLPVFGASSRLTSQTIVQYASPSLSFQNRLYALQDGPTLVSCM